MEQPAAHGTDADRAHYCGERSVEQPTSGFCTEASGYSGDAPGYCREASGYCQEASGHSCDASGYSKGASGESREASAHGREASAHSGKAMGAGGCRGANRGIKAEVAGQSRGGNWGGDHAMVLQRRVGLRDVELRRDDLPDGESFEFVVNGVSIYVKGNITGLPTLSLHPVQQHSTAQHSTAQHSTAQHSTAQHTITFFSKLIRG